MDYYLKDEAMGDRNKKAIILIVSGLALVVLGVGITFLVIKNPFKSKTKLQVSSDSKKVIQLDVPEAETSENAKEDEKGAKVVVTDKTEEGKEKEKTTEKAKATAKDDKKTVTSEKASETKTEEIPTIIIENPNDSAPATQPKPAEIKDDDVIELPFVPYEEIKEN